ncbi:methyltransferase domain-containing protein [uncultured Nostoc sp.]|uniref:class I SAM-dependent methyltransferase n=1 Tax=uncultured Nostoc sp. TaxID=340711 RepID=UPI0035CB7444
MMEANNPEINVDELMNKIREDVVKRQVHSQPIDSKSNLDTSKLKLSISYIENFLKHAESRSNVRTKWPDKLNFFPFNLSAKLQKLILKIINFAFKDQREVNFNIISSLKESVALNYYIIEQIATLKTQLDTSIQGLDERIVDVNNRFQRLDERIVATDTSIQGLNECIVDVNNRFQGLDKRIVATDVNIQGIDDSLNAINTLISSWLTGIQEGLDTVNMRVQGIDEYKTVVDTRIEKLNEHLITIDSRIITANTRIQEINEHYIKNDSYLKSDLMQQKRLITVFLEEAKNRLPEPFSKEQLQTFINEDIHFLDTFYVAFEEQFRGSRKEILDRLKVYLPLIEEAKVGTDEFPILDVGCGRGEWLELLQESGYTAKGIDINRVMLEHCTNRGLEVIESDVITYLQALPDASLSVVSGFHIIEHLPFKILINLVDETVRVLKSGGLAIFESPNPENLVVGACNFYSDPTHLNPLFPPTIKFVLEQRGFSDVQLMRLSEHRLKDPLQLVESDNPIASQLNPLIEIVKFNFYASPDFAVIAKKS